MDRGACWAAVHRVTKSQPWLKWLSMHACNKYGFDRYSAYYFCGLSEEQNEQVLMEEAGIGGWVTQGHLALWSPNTQRSAWVLPSCFQCSNMSSSFSLWLGGEWAKWRLNRTVHLVKLHDMDIVSGEAFGLSPPDFYLSPKQRWCTGQVTCDLV